MLIFIRSARAFSATLVAVCLFAFAPSTGYAETLRCPSTDKIIAVGDAQPIVRERCGAPTSETRRFEVRVVRSGNRRFKSKIEIREWFYDFGSAKLTATLTFEAGRLVRIERGRHGGK